MQSFACGRSVTPPVRLSQRFCTLFAILPVDLVIIGVLLLIVVLVVTVIYGLIVRVPYVPTPIPVARAMVDLARLRGNERVFDLGAGNARILIEAKKKFPSLIATGIELAPTVWLLGRFKIFLSRQNIQFLRRNAHAVDMRDAETIFLYLYPGVMERLEPKFDRELRPGTVVISHAFRFPRRQPVEVRQIGNGKWKKTILRYEW